MYMYMYISIYLYIYICISIYTYVYRVAPVAICRKEVGGESVIYPDPHPCCCAAGGLCRPRVTVHTSISRVNPSTYMMHCALCT